MKRPGGSRSPSASVAPGRWLLTGGAGYIGAHVAHALISGGHEVVVFDDLSTGQASRLPAGVPLVRGTVDDVDGLTRTLRRFHPVGIMHLAGKKSGPESVSEPLLYARENVGGMVALLEAARATGVGRVVFSSSSAVYGATEGDVDEDAPPAPENPYGESKLYAERVLDAASRAHGFGAITLRYFNVVGAGAPALRDGTGLALVPAAIRALRHGIPFDVYGDDYPTADGTCIRDYVDVQDVAEAHVRAAEALERESTVATFNVGRGRGDSVLEVLDAIEAVTGRTLERRFAPRRPGDTARAVGRVDRIADALGWRSRRGLAEMIESAWRAEVGSAVPVPQPDVVRR